MNNKTSKINLYFTALKLLGGIVALCFSMGAYAVACPATFQGQSSPLTCDCNGTPVASLWGTYVYTDDSNICTAAVQAGVKSWFSNQSVTVYPYDSLNHYQGKSVNGVASMNWGPWSKSFTFDQTLFNKQGSSHRVTNLNHLKSLGSSANSITFVAGSDPQFGFQSSTFNYEQSEIIAKVAMAQAADIVKDCSITDVCAPAVAIAGDLVMDRSLGLYWPGVLDMYDSALQGVNNVTDNYAVVLDGLGNHDSGLNLHAYFQNSGKTGWESKYSKWSESSAWNGKSCWNNTYSAAYYCALLTSLKYYSVKLTKGSQSVHVVQLHNGGTQHADPDTVSYLRYLKNAITDGKPLVLVLHHAPELDKNFNNAVKDLNVAAILYGHWHENGATIMQSSNYFTNSHGKSFKAVNVSSFIMGILK
jgi:hypothetical protein